MFSLFYEEIGCIKIPLYSYGLIVSKSVLSMEYEYKMIDISKTMI